MKSCPFCGGKPHVENVPGRIRIVCGACGAGTDTFSCVGDAVSMWDMREHDGSVPVFIAVAANLTHGREP